MSLVGKSAFNMIMPCGFPVSATHALLVHSLTAGLVQP